MVAAKAMPMTSAPAKPSVSPGWILAAARTARAIGIMMRVVAVLETIIETSAVEIMKASSMALGLVPPRLTMPSASLR